MGSKTNAVSWGVYRKKESGRLALMRVRKGVPAVWVIELCNSAFDVQTMLVSAAAVRFEEVPDHPPTLVACLFIGVATHLGATEEALEALAEIVEISDQERALATAKLNAMTESAAKEAKQFAKAVKAAKKRAKKWGRK